MKYGKASPKRTMAQRFARKLKDKASVKQGKIKTLKSKKLKSPKAGKTGW